MGFPPPPARAGGRAPAPGVRGRPPRPADVTRWDHAARASHAGGRRLDLAGMIHSAPKNLRYLILADGSFGPEESKTANACIRYTPERVVGVIDSRLAGKTAQEVLGFGGSIPVVASLEQGLPFGPNALLIGIAPAGGQLPEEGIRVIGRAIDQGLHIWSGLHSLVGDVPELKASAGRRGAGVHEPRRPPAELSVSDRPVRFVARTVGL